MCLLIQHYTRSSGRAGSCRPVEEDPAVRQHTPAVDWIEVVLSACSSDANELGARRLHIPGFVRRAAVDDRLHALPLPHVREACVCLRPDGLLESCVTPRLAGVGADLHSCDFPPTTPR